MSIFEREIPLLGEDGIKKLKDASAAVVGLGGVGSFAFEALVRAGVGTLILIDGDVVSESNINRQLIADFETVGRYKAEVTALRAKKINPECKTVIVNEFLNSENVAKYLDNVDYILDCCDDTSAKTEICVYATENSKGIISCMGTGNKLDPEQFFISDLSKTINCPLARTMRKKLGERGIKHIPVVFSTEIPVSNGRVTSSVSFVPSVAGLYMAGYIIKRIVGIPTGV